MGRGLVIDETLVLVAGVIRVFVLATAARSAWYACARVAIGDEEEGTRACGGGKCRGRCRGSRRGWERTHCRLSLAVVAGPGQIRAATHVTHLSHPRSPFFIYFNFNFYHVFFYFSLEGKKKENGLVIRSFLFVAMLDAGVRQGGVVI